MSALKIKGLSLVRADGVTLVDNVDLALAPGETLGIVGESGSGKSLTLRAILGILPAGITATGEIACTARTAMVFQEPATALNPTMRAGDLVARVWRRHHPGRSKADALTAATELFEQVGIDRAADRLRAWPHELSGGMRQRVMIAAALAAEPEVLLCDEPTTALDVRVQAQILDLLRDLVARRSMAMIFVSHDLAVVASVSERLLVMRRGEVVETGVLTEVLAAPAHEYTAELLAANLGRRLKSESRESRESRESSESLGSVTR
ncbi:ABC-type dipeptide/oligopeptide/nickel transport system ATPase component [Actinoplanes lutulentus]|uniref:Peptide/nickel transport system ATP-binding protein n=1 Tax=Actinoplanes lutulentus TaxID=1287878 RepID=A0A327ZLS9_9ACTN|nr:ABC transporter ATP-binding protein [Actinoplanes lutulentus]MBB2941171.1 ABC-type dipeptide/oligopeptide/nickel transport system ATPase component [Actinoplanes lutulentus]RAK43480.1 peptide/nickel transport system ATP-binding protein [Actinoplanes lutulentus]